MENKKRTSKKRRESPKKTEDPFFPPWASRGKCGMKRYMSLDWFSEDKKEWHECQKVCNSGCPVKDECLRHALEHEATYGVWGGCNPIRMRIALGVNAAGDAWDYEWTVKCPRCGNSNVEQKAVGKRRIKRCVCADCGLSWERKVVPRSQRRRSA